MAKLIKHCLGAVVIFGSINFSYGDPSQCYSCGLEWPLIEEKACNDPIDVSAIHIDHCTQSEFSSFNLTEEQMDKAKVWLPKTAYNKADSYFVCYKVSISAGSSRQTIRGCSYEKAGQVSICEANKQLAAMLGYTFHGCNMCKSELCNSSPSIFLSAITLIICGILVKLVTV